MYKDYFSFLPPTRITDVIINSYCRDWTIFASEDTDSRFVSKLDALLLEKSDREILTLRGNGEIVLQSVRCTLEPKGGSLGFDVAKTQRV